MNIRITDEAIAAIHRLEHEVKKSFALEEQ